MAEVDAALDHPQPDLFGPDVDLAGAIGGNAGDGAADTVTVNGSQAGDVVEVGGTPGKPVVEGLAAVTRVQATR